MLKKFLYLTTLLYLFIFSKPLNASHILGGEISWRCVNGKYVFFMQLYRDCSGLSWTYENESIEIFGDSLPKNASNQIISSINLAPDTSMWLQNNKGQLSPECDTSSSALKCSSGDLGTIQLFYYQSDLIDLNGTPPASGWRFGWEAECCRPKNTNLSTTGAMTLRAWMFPDKNSSDVAGCIDNSPQFSYPPAYAICKGQNFTYNPNAIDRDLDSLAFHWDKSYNIPIANPSPLIYEQGYSYDNPTPDTAFNAKNIAATLNPQTGNMHMEIHSGGSYEQYLTVVRVDAYREGVKIASVYRESPIMVKECPQTTIDSVRGKIKNKPPLVYINGEQREDTLIDVQAGQKIQLPIKIVDHDYSGFPTSPKQKITVVPSGFMFSRDFADPQNCRDFQGESFGPCAYLNNQSPTLNTNIDPPRRELVNRGEINSNFIWDTQCHHLSTLNNDSIAQKEVIYNFILKTFDDHCPLPARSYASISVRLRKPLPLNAPIMKGASVGLDGKLTYSWAPPLDSANAFSAYKAEVATPNEGNPPTYYKPLKDSINNYHQQRKEDNYSGIFNTLPNNQPNILLLRPNTDWYIRMQTASGCVEDTLSEPSEAVRIMEVEATPSGSAPFPKRSSVTLDWNRPKPINSNNYSHYLYESPTHFYIWENDSIELNGGEYLEGENIESNWYLRGDTNATNYTLKTNVCNARVGFRIEARDTVVTWAQGSNMQTGDELDTLTFSTFSTIDTTLMRDAGSLPKPEFDTIIVRENGDLYFKIDRANSGPVAKYKIYKDGDTIPIADFDSKVDSFLYSSFNANNSIGSFVLESESECDQITIGKSSFYTNILLKGELLLPECSLNYELKWNNPSGFTSPIHRFELYIDSANTGFKMVEKITDAQKTSTRLKVIPGVDYKYKIIAIDRENSVNISGILNYTAPTNLRSFDIVPAPELLCANVESNGEVTLSFIPPKDTTNNGLAYKFEYKQSNSNFWKQFGGSANVDYENDNTVTITGINALSNDYDFRAKTISGCDGVTPSTKWSTLSNDGIQVMDQFLDYLYVDGKKAISYQWVNCNSNRILPIDTLQQFVPFDTGTFAVYVEYEDCSDTSICYTVDHLFDTAVTQLNYNTLQSEESSAYYQWIDCRADTLIPGANQQKLVATDTGYYAVIMRAYGYSDTSECVPIFTVGVDEFGFSEHANIYPNPTKGTLSIETGTIHESLQIKIRNIHGQLMQEEQFVNQSNIQLQLNGKSGIYFIELINENGERANVKVIKN